MKALQLPTELDLHVLSPGNKPPNPSELLASHRMKALIAHMSKRADWIILDSPPLLSVADASAVARWADGVLLVSRARFSTKSNAERGRKILEQVGARLVGVVVWGVGLTRPGMGHGYYSTSGASFIGESDSNKSKRDKGPKSGGPVKPGKAGLSGGIWAAVITGAFILMLVIASAILLMLDARFGWGISLKLRHLVAWVR